MVLICKISNERERLDHRGSIWHQYFAIRHSELSSTPSQDSADGSQNKASILITSRPFLVSFQPAALTHGPFCWEQPMLPGQGRVGGGFFVGQTVVFRCTYPPSAVLWQPGLVHSYMLQCGTTPQLYFLPLFAPSFPAIVELFDRSKTNLLHVSPPMQLELSILGRCPTLHKTPRDYFLVSLFVFFSPFICESENPDHNPYIPRIIHL